MIDPNSPMKIIHHHIPGSNHKPIAIDARWNNEGALKGVVVFCHGYKGFKDWGAWNPVADYFADQGYAFVKFNMSHGGTSLEHPQSFVDLEAFGNNTYSRELDDLNSVMDAVQHDPEFEALNQLPILLIGHSRGGGIVTLSASENQGRVVALSGWAAVSDFEVRFPLGKQMKDWKEKGVYYVLNARTKQELPHYYSFYEDYIANQDRLNIRPNAYDLDLPALFCHAMDDPAVHVSESMRLHKWMKRSELELFDTGGHTFGASHPAKSSDIPYPLTDVVKRTVSYFDKITELRNKNQS